MMSTCYSKHVQAWNKHIEKECIKLVIIQNYFEMHGQQNIKLCLFLHKMPCISYCYLFWFIKYSHSYLVGVLKFKCPAPGLNGQWKNTSYKNKIQKGPKTKLDAGMKRKNYSSSTYNFVTKINENAVKYCFNVLYFLKVYHLSHVSINLCIDSNCMNTVYELLL